MIFSNVTTVASYDPYFDHLHSTKQGETLDKIATDHGCEVKEIVKKNPQINPNEELPPEILLSIPWKR